MSYVHRKGIIANPYSNLFKNYMTILFLQINLCGSYALEFLSVPGGGMFF